MLFRLIPAAVLAVALAVATPAAAQKIEVLGVFKDWTAYKTTQGGQPLCYMASKPKKDEGKYKKRGDIYAMVAHRPAAKANNVISIRAGYTYKAGGKPRLKIGGKTFTLFSNEDKAWATNAQADRAIVKAMKGGRTMIVTGVSSRGTKTRDTYSLLGFSAAHRAIGKACKVK